MAQHEARLSRRGPAVLPLHDLDIGPADPDGDGFHEHRAVTHIRLRDLLQPCGPRLLRFYRDGFHMVPSVFFQGTFCSRDSFSLPLDLSNANGIPELPQFGKIALFTAKISFVDKEFAVRSASVKFPSSS